MENDNIELLKKCSVGFAVISFFVLYFATLAPTVSQLWLLAPPFLFVPGLWSSARYIRRTAVIGLGTSLLLLSIGIIQRS